MTTLTIAPGDALEIEFCGERPRESATAVTGIQAVRSGWPYVRVRYQRDGRKIEVNWPLDFLRLMNRREE